MTTEISEKDKILGELASKYKHVFAISPECDPEIYIVCKRAGRAEYKQLKLDANNPQLEDVADENLVLNCLLHPTRAEVIKMFDELPFFVTPAAKEILRQSGGSVKKQ